MRWVGKRKATRGQPVAFGGARLKRLKGRRKGSRKSTGGVAGSLRRKRELAEISRGAALELKSPTDQLGAFAEKYAALLEFDARDVLVVESIPVQFREAMKATLWCRDIVDLAPEVMAIYEKARAKGRRGRPAEQDSFACLDAAASAKVQSGRYRHIAPKWGRSPKQLSRLVAENRAYFDAKVKVLRATSI